MPWPSSSRASWLDKPPLRSAPENAVLPHRYPFRFVDEGRGGSSVSVFLTSDSPWLQRGEPLSLGLAVEIMAQASHVLLGGGENVYLAGVESARLLASCEAGDRLEAQAKREGAFAGMFRVSAALERDGVRVAEATLILVNSAISG